MALMTIFLRFWQSVPTFITQKQRIQRIQFLLCKKCDLLRHFRTLCTKLPSSHKYSETQKPKKERIKEAISVILIGVEDPVIDY